LIEMRGNDLVAVVKDTGCGLDAAFIPDMWTPFTQGEVRGSARGTGLGLSIIQRLVHRMNGKIDVESQYEHAEGVGPEKSGTTFTVMIPVQSTNDSPRVTTSEEWPRVAILSQGSSRAMEGLRICWESYGFSVAMVPCVSALAKSSWKYVWADLDFLTSNTQEFEALLRNSQYLVLVPFDTQDSLADLPGILTAPNFVLVPKPLIWHTFERKIAASHRRNRVAAPSQALRFASEVRVHNGETKTDYTAKVQNTNSLVLLVEDNAVRSVDLSRSSYAFSNFSCRSTALSGPKCLPRSATVYAQPTTGRMPLMNS
jgi:hypothetical protein